MVPLIGLLGAKGAGKDTAARILIERLGFVRTSFATALYQEVANAYGVSVEFLENREFKETPLLKLKLANCADIHFVEVALRLLAVQAGAALTPVWMPAILRPLFSVIGFLQVWLFRDTLLHTPRSPRWVLQLWGTEYRRRSRYGHDSYWLDKVRVLILANPQTHYVITDVRFKNEADFVEEMGGLLVRIRRLALELLEEAARRAGKGTALHPSETELLQRPVAAEPINREGDPLSLLEGLAEIFPQLRLAA